MINAYCQDTVYLIRKERDKWGETTDTRIKMKARFEPKTKLVRNQAGETVVSSARVFVKDSIAVEHADRIEFNSKQYSIINVEQAKDFSAKFKRLDLM